MPEQIEGVLERKAQKVFNAINQLSEEQKEQLAIGMKHAIEEALLGTWEDLPNGKRDFIESAMKAVRNFLEVPSIESLEHIALVGVGDIRRAEKEQLNAANKGDVYRAYPDWDIKMETLVKLEKLLGGIEGVEYFE